MLPPNPYLPDATGIASGNGYNFSSTNNYSPSFQSPVANFAAQAAPVVAAEVTRRAAPVVKRAVQDHGPDMLLVCGRFGLQLLKAISGVR